jgi:tRNA threonylcarbamoyladenosine modification (KEOPS) complex Cgi121 subunit
MTDPAQKLVDGETMRRADREREIREAIERLFVDGLPNAIIILADTGRDVRVQCVGPIAELRALSLTGMAQCVSMLDNALEPVPRRLDS